MKSLILCKSEKQQQQQQRQQQKNNNNNNQPFYRPNYKNGYKEQNKLK